MKYLVLIAVAAVALTRVQCDDYKAKDSINLGELISLVVSNAISLVLGSIKSGEKLDAGVLADGISGLILKELDLDTDKAAYTQGDNYSEKDDDDKPVYHDDNDDNDDNDDDDDEYNKEVDDYRAAEPKHYDDKDKAYHRSRRTLLLKLKKQLLGPASRLLRLG